MDTWEHQLFNVAGIINSSFDIKKSISDNPENVLKIFEKIYFTRNVEKTIEKIQKKCFK